MKVNKIPLVPKMLWESNDGNKFWLMHNLFSAKQERMGKFSCIH